MKSEFIFKEQMASGIKWVGLGSFFGYLLQFIVWAILARLLSPEGFGALGVALAFSNSALIFNELGMASAIIQRKDLTQRHKVITFWVCIGIGLLFLISAVLVSSTIARFFHNSSIAPLIIVFSLKIFVDSFGIVNEALLKRELLFRKLTYIEICSSFLFGIVAVIMAVKGFGIISLAFGYLSKSMAKVALLWYNYYFRLRFEFDKQSFNELFSFGRNIVGSKILNYICNNIDIVLVGKFLGITSLGLYSMILNLVNFPRHKLSLIVSQVAFPALSKLQDHIYDLRNAYLKIVRYAAVINFPLLIGLILVAPQFIQTIYSSKWNGMILPLQILCIYGLFFSVTTFVGIIFNSTGHPEYSFKFSLAILTGTILAILIGLKYNLIGVAIALSVFAIIMNILGHTMIRHIIKVKFSQYVRSMTPAIVSSTVMALGLVLIIWLQKNLFMLFGWWYLLLAISSGMLIFVLTLFLVSRQTFKEAMEIIRRMF